MQNKSNIYRLIITVFLLIIHCSCSKNKFGDDLDETYFEKSVSEDINAEESVSIDIAIPRHIAIPSLIFNKEKGQRMGFATMAYTQNVNYYVTESALTSSESIINRCETLLAIMKNEYGLQFKPFATYIFSSDEGVPAAVRGMNPVLLDESDDSSAYKVLMAAMLQKNNYPAWLAYGISQYWLTEYELLPASEMNKDEAIKWVNEHADSLPPFGDAWMLPDFYENTAILKNVIYQFINYLIETHPDTFLQLINETDMTDFDQLANDLWVFFTGTEAHIQPTQHWRMTLGFEGSFTVETDQAIYTFSAAEWRWDTFNQAIDKMDNRIQYVKNFFEVEHDDKILVLLEPKPDGTVGGKAGGNTIFIYENINDALYTVIHEAVHIISINHNYESSRTPRFFSDGVANLVPLLFFLSEDDTARKQYNRDFVQTGINNQDEFYINSVAYYKEITNEDYLTIPPERINILAWINARILAEQKVGSYASFSVAELGVDSKYGSYLQAGSFCYYLYCNYGKEAVFSLMADYKRVKSVTGYDYPTLFEQWCGQLKVLTGE